MEEQTITERYYPAIKLMENKRLQLQDKHKHTRGEENMADGGKR
jgi:hypothetical protein